MRSVPARWKPLRPRRFRPWGGTPLDCPCEEAFPYLAGVTHDHFAGFEDGVARDGVAAVVDAMLQLDANADSDSQRGELNWFEFKEFVARHSWRQPHHMVDFANFVADAIERRHKLSSLEMGTRMAGVALAEAGKVSTSSAG